MARKHKWEYPYHYAEYFKSLENPNHPKFELVEELEVGHTGFDGSGHAWVVRDTENDVICLQSYLTIVSVKAGDDSVDLGKWSRTTTRHQFRFSAWCGRHATLA